MNADGRGRSRIFLIVKIFAPFAFSAVSFCRQLNDSTSGDRCLLSELTVVVSANLWVCGGLSEQSGPGTPPGPLGLSSLYRVYAVWGLSQGVILQELTASFRAWKVGQSGPQA